MKTIPGEISAPLKVILLLSLVFGMVHGMAAVPVTGAGEFLGTRPANSSLPTLADFTTQVMNGKSSQVTGIFVEGIFAFPVVQQPTGKAAYVAASPDTITQFASASSFGSLGFLAHNYLAGSQFVNLAQDVVITLIYGDGRQENYQVIQVRRFQALKPTDPYSNFKDLEAGVTLTANDLFYQTYGVSSQVILQTCISNSGIDSWGRLFVIAAPYLAPRESVPTKMPHYAVIH